MKPQAPPTHNLPVQLTSFVGRDLEIAAVRDRLRRARLVTIAGAPGLGKSRLAIEVASGALPDHPGGVRFIDLAALADPRLVPGEAARSMGVHLPSGPGRGHLSREGGGGEQPGADWQDAVREQVGGRRLLLVVDNCEHLLDACARLVEWLLAACPGLRVLATSHQPLGVTGEQVWRLDPLALPPAGAARPAATEAVRLLEARARLVQPQFAVTPASLGVVAAICRRLDGIPLAIELAAARLEMMSVDDLLERIEDRFRLLTGGSRTAMPRHRTLRAALDWGHHLLNDDERKLFRRLSVFPGGFDAGTAAAIAGGAGLLPADVPRHLQRLFDRSLLALDATAAQGGRYRLLETIRQYAAERLGESGEEEATRWRHAGACLKLAERASAFQRRPGLAAWLERLEAAHDDLRQALRWYRRRDQALWTRLVLSLAWFWLARGHLAEGHDWLSAVLEAPALTGRDRARALYWLSRLALWQGDYEVAVDLGERSRRGFRQAADEVSAGWALDLLGTIHGYAGDPVRARSCLEELLATVTDDELRVSAAASMGEHLLLQGDLAGARRHLERAAASGGPEGRWQMPMGALFLAAADIRDGDLAGGRRRLHGVLEVLDRTRDVFALSGALYLAAALAFLGEDRPERALRLCGAADAWRETLRTPLAPAWRDLLRAVIVEPATARLTPAAAIAAWSEGARMSFGAAVRLARGDGASASPVDEARAAGVADDPAPLSRRELEVALLTARGLPNRLIAERLQIAERTVEGHLERIRAKLGVGSRAQVAVWVVERGWLAS